MTAQPALAQPLRTAVIRLVLIISGARRRAPLWPCSPAPTVPSPAHRCHERDPITDREALPPLGMQAGPQPAAMTRPAQPLRISPPARSAGSSRALVRSTGYGEVAEVCDEWAQWDHDAAEGRVTVSGWAVW